MKLEKEGLVVTPLTEQKTGLWDMAFIWFCANVAVPRLMIGGSLAGLGFGKLILILLAGNILVFLPLLALGIPGSGTGAVLLGGLMMWGLNPGPLLFDSNPEFCWGLISSMYMANVFTLLVAVLVIPFLIKILSVPVKYMIPIITCVCIVGAYSTSNSMYGVVIMFVSGIVGYLLDKNGFPTAPMLLAFVLAPMLEKNMRKAFIASQGSLRIFVDSPLKLVLLAVFLVLVLTPVVKSIRRKMKARKAQA